MGLYGLDAAVAAFEENTGAVSLVDEGEAVAARSQAGEFLDEVVLREAEEF